MSNIKERILGAVTVMNEQDAEKVWNLIQATFALANVEAVEPEEDELEALNAYRSGDSEYQATIPAEEVYKILGI